MSVYKLWDMVIGGFRSYTNASGVDFYELSPGLYHIAGPNGAGKSSMFDAWCWCIFGKTSRGLAADDIRSWDESVKETIVTSALVHGERQHLIVRTRPNSLTVDGKVATQNDVSSILPISMPAVLHSVYFSQFGNRFADLDASKRMQLFSEIMDLDVWEKKADQAVRTSNELDEERRKKEAEVARHEGKIQSLREENYDSEYKQWERDRSKRLFKLYQELDERRDGEKRQRKGLNAQREDIMAHTKRGKHIAGELKKLEAAKIELAKQLRELVNNRGFYLGAESALRSKAKIFGNAEGNCPECGQEVTSKYRAKHSEHVKEQADAQKDEAAKITRRMDKIERKVSQIEAQVEEFQEQLPNMDQARGILVKAEKMHDETLLEIKHLEQLITATKEETNPWKLKDREKKIKIKNARRQLRKMNAEMAEITWFKNAMEFWAKRMRDVRFFLIRESLAQLNVESNRALIALGLHDWQIEFEVEKENKSGTGVRRGFLINIKPPYAINKAWIPWESWAGGETQRLRLATQFGIADMLSARTGVGFDFEFWDEPSNFLDPEGLKQLLSILHDRARTTQRRIFLADHRVYDYPFDGVITIKKGDEGSAIYT